jgi:DNA-binding NarL/FixJ family response regulator
MLYNFSKSEYAVLTLLAEGYSNKAIADKLFVSLKTVENHVHNMMNKVKSLSYSENNNLNFRVLLAKIYWEYKNAA